MKNILKIKMKRPRGYLKKFLGFPRKRCKGGHCKKNSPREILKMMVWR
nr:MAG TPA: hypothetical protein [Caudoviricetes sp.]